MSHWYKPPRKKTTKQVPISEPHDLFTVFCKSEVGYEPVREFRFHPTRKWRFDYAIPALKIAIECDGGVWSRGRHVRPQGYIRDMEKFNAAAEMGWVVLKFTPQQLMTQEAISTLRATISRRIGELAKQSNPMTTKTTEQ